MGRYRKRNKKRNPNLQVGYLYAYQNPLQVVPFDYSRCAWYQEGRIVYSDYSKVVAYVGGYRTEYTVKLYIFHNVRPHDQAKQRLVNYCRDNPEKYPGWLHHINFYKQGDGKSPCIHQLKL